MYIGIYSLLSWGLFCIMDLNAPVAAAQANKQSTQNLVNGFQGQTNDFLGRFRNAIGGQESTTDAATRLGQQNNLPVLQANAAQANRSLQNITPNAIANTRGFDVNNSQLQNLISDKVAKLSPVAQQATQQAQDAQNQVNTGLGYLQTDQAKALQPYQTEAQLMPGIQSLVLSGYNQGNADELSSLLAKQSAGVTLSEGEKNRAQALALAEQQHKYDQENQAAQNAFTLSQPNYQAVSAGNSLYNPATGKFVTAPDPKTKAASTGLADTNAFLQSLFGGGGSTTGAQPTSTFRAG